VKSVLKLYSAYSSSGVKNPLDSLKTLLPSSTIYTNKLVNAIGDKDAELIRESITGLYLNGYLLDDILLSVEKSISLFPSIDPTTRFRVLQFTMLGWISIQQGKEHWLDTMDVVEQVLKS
jgi:hypothetical protein